MSLLNAYIYKSSLKDPLTGIADELHVMRKNRSTNTQLGLTNYTMTRTSVAAPEKYLSRQSEGNIEQTPIRV